MFLLSSFKWIPIGNSFNLLQSSNSNKCKLLKQYRHCNPFNRQPDIYISQVLSPPGRLESHIND